MIRGIVLTAGILGLIGVMIGAFAAHGLESRLSEQGIGPEDIAKQLDQCDVAVRYHMMHTLALLVLGIAAGDIGGRLRRVSAVFFVLGIALFSGGLYSMVFLGEMGHWAIVPSGGLCFMIGWICVVFLAMTKQNAN